jgi:hypothetical protein
VYNFLWQCEHFSFFLCQNFEKSLPCLSFFVYRLDKAYHQDVLIYYDPADLSSIAVYRCEEDRQHFLCRATYQGSEGVCVSLKELVTARNARRKEVREGVRARVQAAKGFLPSEKQIFAVSEKSEAMVVPAKRVAGPAFLQDLPPELLPPDKLQAQEKDAEREK